MDYDTGLGRNLRQAAQLDNMVTRERKSMRCCVWGALVLIGFLIVVFILFYMAGAWNV